MLDWEFALELMTSNVTTTVFDDRAFPFLHMYLRGQCVCIAQNPVC